MPSLRTTPALLFGKELRELAASRAWWLLLLLIGPLVGHGFITAVELYAEASGSGGGPAALAQGLSPLDGILVPTLSAYDLAVTLLFPFIAIRLIAFERSNGGWKLMLQSPASVPAMLAAKAAALLAAWCVAWVPALLAIALWHLYGGWLYAPETLNLLLGHLLRFVLAAGVAVAAAAIAESAASAAIAALGFTVGTWVLEFVAAGRGGWLERAASFTPTSALRVFELGLFRLSTVAVTLLLGLGGFALAAIWLREGWSLRRRAARTALTLAALAIALAAASLPRTAFDLSENRRNSFPAADEAALRRITAPLHVTVYLAAEDPRRMDLDRNILARLERILPDVDVRYAARSRSGLFEAPGDRYGEVWYEIGGRKLMSRSTTERIVLDNLYQLAQVPPPSDSDAEAPGHPLAARPSGAAWVFYVIWPLAVALCGWLHFRSRSR
ncbi:MAG: ABC transporter permease [Acidobacteria bacterium]|nr:ABC transporter permease [Acidobacteriota bacterium]